jgi:protein-L-isoaspartate(D-aspartate) O-methyltransferase
MMPHLGADAGLPRQGPELLVEACRAEGVTDQEVLKALARVRREDFVPPDWVGQAYRDRPIPIPHGQVTTQPSLVARMVASLRLRGDERVLEVGTGLGFQTAVLASLARWVFSIERFANVAAWAETNLRDAGIENVTVVVGDGTLGLPDEAPFQAIIVSAAAPRVPDPLVDQLADGRRITHPVGFGGNEIVTTYRKDGDRLVPEAPGIPAHFVRLIGAHGLAEEA